MNFWLLFLSTVTGLSPVVANIQKVVEKCCEPSLRDCCLKSVENNDTLQCAGSNWRATTKCIETELHNESLLESGAEYCCAMVAFRECREKCVNTMRQAAMSIDDRLNIVEKCTVENSTEADADKPLCYTETRKALNECFPMCVEWYRITTSRTTDFKPHEQCDILSDSRTRFPCSVPN